MVRTRTKSRLNVGLRLSCLVGWIVLAACSCSTSPTTDAGCEALTPAPCAAGQFLYDDESCGGPLPDGGTPICEEVGDGLCYDTCAEDSDCADPCRPFCRTMGLFRGGDFQCNGIASVCSSSPDDQCVPGS